MNRGIVIYLLDKITIPLWAFSVIMLSYVHSVGPLTLANILTLGLALLFVGKVLMGRRKYISRPILYILLFLFGTVCLHMISTTGDMPQAKHYAWPVLIIFGTSFIAGSKSSLRRLIYWLVFMVSFSSLVAIFQSVNIGFAWDLRLWLGGVPDNNVLIQQIVDRTKPSGLAYYSVQLSYQISVFFPFALYLYFDISKNKFQKQFMLAVILVIAIGAIVINSLIAMCSVLISVLIIILKERTYINRRVRNRAAVLVMAVIITAFLSGGFGRLQNVGRDTEALSRLPMLITGILILTEHPMGVKNEQFIDMKGSVGGSIISDMAGSLRIDDMGLHNSYLTCGVSKGAIVMALYILLTIYIIFLIYKRYKNNKSEDKFIYIVVGVAYVCYTTQSVFHNAGLPGGDLFGWLLLSIICQIMSDQHMLRLRHCKST